MDRLANGSKKLFFGFTQLQFLILVATMAQNSGYVLIRRYSQGVIKESASSSAVGIHTPWRKLRRTKGLYGRRDANRVNGSPCPVLVYECVM